MKPDPTPRIPTHERALLRAGLYLALAGFGLVLLGATFRLAIGRADDAVTLTFSLGALGATVALAGLAASARRYRDE